MGIDFLDIAFRVEADLGVKLDPATLAAMSDRWPSRADVTVAELIDYFVDALRRCGVCDYSLYGHAAIAVCPECGKRFEQPDRDRVTTVVRSAIAAALGLNLQEVSEERFLVRDLGMQ